MKIYWEKIPRCFKYAAMDAKKRVVAFLVRPQIWDDPGDLGLWMEPSPYGMRPLIEHDEYKLDGTEDWKESLQERPKECSRCNGKGKLAFGGDMGEPITLIVCRECNGTGTGLEK